MCRCQRSERLLLRSVNSSAGGVPTVTQKTFSRECSGQQHHATRSVLRLSARRGSRARALGQDRISSCPTGRAIASNLVPKPQPALYRPGKLQLSDLYQLLETHYHDVNVHWEDRFEKVYGYRCGFVDNVVLRYFDCGVPWRPLPMPMGGRRQRSEASFRS